MSGLMLAMGLALAALLMGGGWLVLKALRDLMSEVKHGRKSVESLEFYIFFKGFVKVLMFLLVCFVRFACFLCWLLSCVFFKLAEAHHGRLSFGL
jgi:hypothetical protein